MITRRALLGIGSATALGLLVGCGEDGPRPLTTAESERLAVIRFNAYDEGTRALQLQLFGTPEPLRLTGWVDYRSSVAYAEIRTADGAEQLGLVHWDKAVKASRPAPVPDPVLPPPADGWQRSPLDHEQAVFDTALAMVLQLGMDRPDNPLLLAQSDARWLRSDRVGDVTVDVMTGPTPEGAPDQAGSRLRYWVDERGHLLRLEAVIGPTDLWSTFDFATAEDVAVPALG
ncbi:hypothetical protein GC722_08660 [Auraticoccus sp. F435]|uniref:LppX_LprAFG lipoprotein n=1 Tax=Auraticoccus cholistanensis TaxID=2656650 RepID=A0A6A9UTU4_9ACTN|nr:hypothetical protein [Auraticoccus cholistanensis]MVA76091.1 hypothetical protein [Auraticoccus cholistanensis]